MKVKGEIELAIVPRFLYVLVVMNMLLIWNSEAQNCTQTLKKAQLTYDEGRISEVPVILENCLKNGFNREERAASYRLLTLTYLYLDEPDKADQSMLMLLRTNHEYVLNTPVDPAEFVNLYNKFRTRPVYTIGIRGGINFNTFSILKPFSVSGNPKEATKPKIKSSTGFQVGAVAEIPIKGGFEFAPELILTFKGYYFNYSTVGQQAIYEEKLNLIQLPLLLKYSFGKRNYIPYIIAGFETGYILYALGSTSNTIVSPSTNFALQRSALCYSMAGGVGLKNNLGPGVLSIGVRINYGLNAIVIKSKIYEDNGAFGASYGVVANQMRLSSYAINLGYLIPIYNPKKVR